MRFTLAQGASMAEFLAADKALQEGFAYRQPGLLRRTTARSDDGGWIVIDLWASAEASADAARRWDDDPFAQRFMALLYASSVAVERYEEIG